MLKQTIYNLAAKVIPKPYKKTFTLTEYTDNSNKNLFVKACSDNFRKHMCYGATLSLFDEQGIRVQMVYGNYAKDKPVNSDTFFRVASVIKKITAQCVMKLAEENKNSIYEVVHNFFADKITDQK
ncbi:MAG: serine hydrolase, partial [Eubacteriales bacterium]|nr:serine hydrolase [Eubacteriales bacterium]